MRRAVFLTSALLLAGAGLLGTLQRYQFVAPNPYLQAQAESDPLKEIEAKYRIECVAQATPLSVQTQYGEITGRPVDFRTVKWYPRLFAEELRRYPASLV